jgi:hypothetical protein
LSWWPHYRGIPVVCKGNYDSRSVQCRGIGRALYSEGTEFYSPPVTRLFWLRNVVSPVSSDIFPHNDLK